MMSLFLFYVLSPFIKIFIASTVKLTYHYAFVNGFLELAIKDIDSKQEGKPVIHKEVWTLQKRN
ncbi:hypothetical protein [Sphingobacterium sp. UBA5996]|uniref:hypothetical protein n=1 Tax=Sphingobacterium sp. UBA5996 TaxID=1947505 RepID=UPI0025ED3AE7|nr:hypothetical protein [Sphingobacterium sp. UBA5996]